MTLEPQPRHPNALCYVLKLQRDSAPDSSRIRGRLEHLRSGETFTFASAAELLELLCRHAAGQTEEEHPL